MRVTWREFEVGAVRQAEVDADRAIRDTADDGDIAATVASMLVREAHPFEPSWAGLEDGRSVTVEILSPPALAGHFGVAISRKVVERGDDGRRRLVDPPEGLRAPLAGTSAVRLLSPIPGAELARQRAVARLTAPEDVERSYQFLGNRYGHDIDYTDDRADDDKVRVLRGLYDDATLHDLGWPVRCSGGVGVLMDRPLEDGEELDAWAVSEFERERGLVVQSANRWCHREANLSLVFVPFDRVAEAQDIAAAMRDLPTAGASPRP